MVLNEKKPKNMIFNFSKNYQFSTVLKVNDSELDMVSETKLLGTVITDKLTWDRNSEELIKKGYKRMQLLNAAASYTNARNDLKDIYLTFIRSILEQSAVVWHSSLTQKNRKDLERVQKAAVRVIMGESYISYKHRLKVLKLDTLERRREKLCLRFAQNCLKTEKVKNLFPLNNSKHKMNLRNKRKYKTNKQNTKRYKNSALPYMRKLLNNEHRKKQKIIKEIQT